MNRHPSDCRCCSLPAATEAAAPEPIQLPDQPTPIRVHSPGRGPFDCVLHPDGTLAAVMGGELVRNALTLAEMRERNWAQARIEFNPAPLVEEPGLEPVAEAVQEALIA